MAENTIDFNPKFDGNVANELNRRADANNIRDSFFRYWNYQKYCYINISVTEGQSETAVTPEVSMVIGDRKAPTGGFGTEGDMYTSEGEGNSRIRKPKPILSSVKITNQGGEDYTESAIYEVEASFKVFTLGDLEKVEKSFFIIGAQMDVEFGWRNHPVLSNGITNSGNPTDADIKGIKTSIYNFNFSIESDGSYNCSVKAISAAALFSQTTAGVEDAEKEPGDTDNEDTKTNVISQLIKLHKAAFGVKKGEDISDINIAVGDDDDGTIGYKQYNGSKSFYNQKLDFYMGNIENGEFFTFDDSVYVPYIRLGSLIDYLNGYFKQAGGDDEIKFEFTTGPESKYPVIKGFGSADPGKFVLFGEMAKYNSDSKGSLNWSSIGGDSRSENNLQSIIVSLTMIQGFYNQLSTEKLGGSLSPSITKLLGKIFNEIDVNTGGLITPKLIPKNTDASAKAETMYIMNRKTIVSSKEEFPTPYTFSAIGERAVGIRSISLESDYDSDLLVLASTKAISEGASNTSKLKRLYPGNTGLDAAAKKAESKKGTSSDALKELEKARFKLGEDGYTSDRISAYRSAMANYINQFFDIDTNLQNGGYGELPLMLKLSVTIDIKFLSPITVDRLPNRFKNDPKIAFGVTSVEHSFDGQGDWETTLGTVMRIR
jgi:hypothetical protein